MIIHLTTIQTIALIVVIFHLGKALNNKNETGKFSIDLDIVSIVESFILTMFLSMTLMNFKLWELKKLALLLIIILIGQTVLIEVFAHFIAFRLTGKD